MKVSPSKLFVVVLQGFVVIVVAKSEIFPQEFSKIAVKIKPITNNANGVFAQIFW